ncbi:MAG: LamG domain-containing protein [Candidatus Sungbacteria bacterium]|uniref:LamG domain-containing protein n=1 Tax=Candidatus Sungiibacteriota bacterium TaxID=2750080 RepID=A0A9D6QYE6_9BACT|nr:LamG domain-containing protein [Candidatus Sungbacteria bacterium]
MLKSLNIYIFKSCCLFVALLIIASFFALPHNTLAAAPTNGLVGYWPFEEGQGTVTGDLSGSGSFGTLTNMASPPTSTSGWGSGKLGRGLNFDGTNDYVDMGNTAILKSTFGGDFSVCFWENNTQTTIGRALGKNVPGMSIGANYASGNAAGRWSFYTNDGSDSSSLSTPTTMNLSNGAWHHLCATRSGTTQNWYAEGAFVNSRTQVGSNATNNSSFRVGHDGSGFGLGTQQYGGKIDEVSVYNRALSAAEINQVYAEGRQRIVAAPSNGLVGYWPLEEGAGTITGDLSGNNQIGTLTNSPTWIYGKLGKGLNFNVTGSTYVNMQKNALYNFSNNFSLGAWIQRATSSASGPIINRGKGGFTGYTMNLGRVNNDSNCTTSQIDAKQYANRSNCLGNVPLDTAWHHIMISFSSTAGLRAYVDGALSATISGDTDGIITGNNYSLQIGANQSSDYFTGKIDEPRVYNRALSAAEITQLYNEGRQKIVAAPTNGLVLYYPFDEKYIGTVTNGSITNDYSGSNNPATLTTLSYRSGKYGNAILQAAAGYASSTVPTSFTGAFSVSTWFLSTNNSCTCMLEGNGNGGSNAKFGIFSSKMFVRMVDGGTTDNTVAVPTQNQWHHAVLVRNASNIIVLYVDGIPYSLYAGAAQSGTYQVNMVGAASANGQNWTGMIDEFRLYNRALSAAEIQQLYNSGRTRLK